MKRKIVIALLLLTIAGALIVILPIGREEALSIARWAESNPERAWPLFLLSFVIAVVVLIPGWVFMVAGGYLFGSATGVVLAFIANLLGSAAAFFLAKTYARRWITQKLDRSERFNGFDNAVAKNGIYTVMFARLALLPNGPINYACGVSAMSLRDFVIGTSIGCLPILVVNVLIGAGAKDIFAAMQGGALEKPELPLALLGGILAIMILIVFLAKRFGTRLVQAKP